MPSASHAENTNDLEHIANIITSTENADGAGRLQTDLRLLFWKTRTCTEPFLRYRTPILQPATSCHGAIECVRESTKGACSH